MTSFTVEDEVNEPWIFLWIEILGWTFECKKNCLILTTQICSRISARRPTFRFSMLKKSIKNSANSPSDTSFLANRVCWIRWLYQFLPPKNFIRFFKTIMQPANAFQHVYFKPNIFGFAGLQCKQLVFTLWVLYSITCFHWVRKLLRY